ncbi:MAG: hypothetical protein JG765_902 [Cereibacter sp.]|jgi:uncharacterized protein (TIGR02284 family)|nr:hypothetical protein [Cereibacter sp.]
MTSSTDTATEALETLHTRSVDVLAGFETMVEKAEPAFRPIAERFRSLHQRQIAEIAAMLTAAGRQPDADGSFMSTVNRAVVSVRAFVDEIDADVLGQVQSGEQHVLDAYADALDRPQTPANAARLAEMRQELAVLLAEAQASAPLS